VAEAIEKGREGVALSPDELTAMFAETRPESIEEMRQGRDERREELAGETVTFVVTATQRPNVCVVGCAFCGSGRASARRTPTSMTARSSWGA